VTSSAWSGPEVAAELLRFLLARPGAYRNQWMRRVGRARAGQISQAAVARVIADYLMATGGLVAPDGQGHRQIKDRVYRALSGKSLTHDTLTWFTSAFAFDREDSRELWARFTGVASDEVEAYLGTFQAQPQTVSFHQPVCDTTSLQMTLEVDEHGRSRRHHSRQRLRATAERVSRYTVRLQFEIAGLEILSGIDRTSPPYPCGRGLYAVDVDLERPLRRDEEALIEYNVIYGTSSREKNFLCGASQHIYDAEISVRFHPAKEPKAIWWGNSRQFSADPEPYLREPVVLRNGRISKRLTSAERAVMGFFWDWSES
jgi:hypothetical protein